MSQVTVEITVERFDCNCEPPGEEHWACNCPPSERTRTVVADVGAEDVTLVRLYDEDGRQISLGDLSMQEQDRARDAAADATPSTTPTGEAAHGSERNDHSR